MQIGKFHPKIRKSIFVGIIAIFCPLGLYLSVEIPTFKAVKTDYEPSDLWILDRNDVPLESIRSKKEKRSLGWQEWTKVSFAFQSYLIQSEDRRFFKHSGVDFLALGKALYDRLRGHSFRGASTLSMQVAGLLNEGVYKKRRTSIQKLSQILYALKLDYKWSKEEILEAYINLVPFRGELVGLRAASLGYFSKEPSGLLDNESALLVALVRSPNSNPDRLSKRACQILNETNCTELTRYSEEVFSKPYQLSRHRELVPILSNYFIKAKVKNSGVIQTTIDYKIQSLAQALIKEQLLSLKNRNVRDAAVLVLENATGNALAYVANAGAKLASSAQIDAIQAKRQAGSTIKPIVYATAFDWNILNPSALLEDSPADISVSAGRVYHPKNYDQTFRGLVSVADALGSSLNVPAVRALQLVGESRVIDRLKALHIEKVHDDGFYGPSLALGSIDLSLWELTNAYRNFALEESVFSRETRKAIFNILSATEHRRFTFGTDSILNLPFAAAVKTGTSKDMRDNWCIGWTEKYTVGVWVGNFSGAPMWNVSGLSGAAPIWTKLMLSLHQNPVEIKQIKYLGAEALNQRSLSKISYPAPNMLVGLDQDIPKSVQKMPIEIENPQKGQQIFINKKRFSKAKDILLWPIQKGKFQIELKSKQNEVVDSLNFEVR